MKRRLAGIFIALCLSSAGCSLVFDPGNRMGAPGDAGTGMDSGDPGVDAGDLDAGDLDAGDSMDAGSDDAGSSDAGGDAGSDAGPSYSPDDFCSELSTAACNSVPVCCSTGASFDVATCIADAIGTCEAYLNGALARPELRWNQETAMASIAETQRLYADCDHDVLDWFWRRDGGYSGLEGTRILGEACNPASLTEDEIALAMVSCVPDHACVQRAVGMWQCERLGAPGAPCQSAIQCAGERPRCNPGFRSECGLGAAEGTICTRSDQCLHLSCEPAGLVSRCGNVLATDEIFCPSPSDLRPGG